MDEKVVWESDSGTFLKITVKPKSKKKKLVEHWSEGEIIFNLKSPAKEGKANTELLKRLSKVLSISSSEVKIVAGHKSKTKTILVEGLSIEKVKLLLRAA